MAEALRQNETLDSIDLYGISSPSPPPLSSSSPSSVLIVPSVCFHVAIFASLKIACLLSFHICIFRVVCVIYTILSVSSSVEELVLPISPENIEDICLLISVPFVVLNSFEDYIGNAIGDRGAIALADVLSENNRSLRNLFLAGTFPLTWLKFLCIYITIYNGI